MISCDYCEHAECHAEELENQLKECLDENEKLVDANEALTKELRKLKRITEGMNRNYEYLVTKWKVSDGDTVDFEVLLVNPDLGFGFTDYNQQYVFLDRFRLYGINCPESDTEEGEQATVFTTTWLSECNRLMGDIIVRTFKNQRTGNSKRGKYGRWLAEVWCDGECLNRELLKAGHAVAVEY